MSKSEIKRLSVLKGFGLPDGFTKDLPDTGGTTMWTSDKECPIDCDHDMAETGRMIFCVQCCCYWNK